MEDDQDRCEQWRKNGGVEKAGAARCKSEELVKKVRGRIKIFLT